MAVSDYIPKLGAPTWVYIVLLLLGNIPIALSGAPGAIGTVVGSLICGAIWACLVEFLYRKQYFTAAWILALLPIIFLALIIVLILGLVAGLH
jgi:hypothetical protein